MQAYIAVSYSKRKLLQPVLDIITGVLKDFSITPFIFADQYFFPPSQEKEMMQQAFAEIDKSSLLIAEVSDKAIGIGVEAGYAKAKGKPVIYLRHRDAEHSTTIAGASDYAVIYKDTEDLKNQLIKFLPGIKP